MTSFKNIALKTLVCTAFIAAPTAAIAGDKSDKENMRDFGYIVGSQMRKDKEERDIIYMKDGERRKIFGTKKLYENDDVIVYRGYDTKGKRYTITKRK